MCDSGRPVDKKIRCVKVSRPELDDGRNCYVMPIERFELGGVGGEFDSADAGDKVLLEYCEMTEAELDVLPEFEGW